MKFHNWTGREHYRVGDLVMWLQGSCDIPGIILEIKPAKSCDGQVDMTPYGTAALVMLPEFGNEPEWFHECELELVCCIY